MNELKLHFAENNLPLCRGGGLYPLITTKKELITCRNCRQYVGIEPKKKGNLSKSFYSDVKVLIDRAYYGLDAKELAEK